MATSWKWALQPAQKDNCRTGVKSLLKAFLILETSKTGTLAKSEDPDEKWCRVCSQHFANMTHHPEFENFSCYIQNLEKLKLYNIIK